MEIAALAVSLAAVVVAISSTLFERRQRILELSLLREQMARGRTANVSLTQEDTYREYGYFVWEFTVANTGLAAAEDGELKLLTERGDDVSRVGARHRGALVA